MFRIGLLRMLAFVVIGYAGFGAARPAAEETKRPDLSELRDAVTTASKRGENVDEIRKALDALEKVLAKGWTAPKPGTTTPTPAELMALRQAVEAAAKKGEKVEVIARELEVVEKLLVGRAFGRITKADIDDFVAEVLKATDILAKRYHRELDKNELIDWAVDGLYLTANEKVPDAVLLDRSRRRKEDLIDGQLLLGGARATLGTRDDLVDAKDVQGSVRYVCGRLDENTTILTAQAMGRMRAQQYQNGLGEAGVQVRRVPDRGIEVVTPYKDGPAYKAGIRAGDLITQIQVYEDAEGKPLAKPSVFAPNALIDEDLDRVLWGRPGARVELTVGRQGAKPKPIEITRARVKRESLFGHKREADDTWDHLLDEKHGVYYIRLLDFHRSDLANELAQLVTKLEAQKMKGLILDLRFAGSGLVDTAIGVADLFVDNGLIVEFRGRSNSSDKKMGHRTGSRLQFPMVCLINSSSGTCTEVVAACLQDHKRALIAGERTIGKASVQNYHPLDRGTLRVTTAHAYRPSGKPLDRTTAPLERADEWGVTPDDGYAVNLPKAEQDALRDYLESSRIIPHRDPDKKDVVRQVKDRQLEKALEYLRGNSKPE